MRKSLTTLAVLVAGCAVDETKSTASSTTPGEIGEGVVTILLVATGTAEAEMFSVGTSLEDVRDKVEVDLYTLFEQSSFAVDRLYPLELEGNDLPFDLVAVSEWESVATGVRPLDSELSDGVADGEGFYENVRDNVYSRTTLYEVQRAQNADLVLVLTGSTANKSGYARTTKYGSWEVQAGTVSVDFGDRLTGPADKLDDPNRGNAVARWNNPTTHIHELGHLFGGRHDTTEEPICNEDGFPACGAFVDLGSSSRSWTTLMAYPSRCDEAIGHDCANREMVFSSTQVTHLGEYPGQDSSEHENRCTVRNLWAYVSRFSEVDPHPAETGLPSAQQSDTSGVFLSCAP